MGAGGGDGMYLIILGCELLAGVVGFLVGRTFGPMKCLYDDGKEEEKCRRR